MAGRKEEAYFDRAEKLYVHENMTPEQIAGMLPVSQNTLYKWREKGGWEAKRRAALTESKSLSDMLMRRLENLINAFQVKEGMTADDLVALPKISDAICKTVASLKKLEQNFDIRASADVVMSKYVDFLRSPELQITAGELQMHSDRLRLFFRTIE